MIFLPKPLPNVEPEDIFEECIQTFRQNMQEKLQQCTELVETDSDRYEQLIPERIDQFHSSALPANVSTEDMVKVYTQKFVPKDMPGRKYYDAIMAGARRGICPICGVRPAYTLDHYLPKGKMPTLAVSPVNLIPSCRDCNMDKRAEMELDPEKTPVHIYLDCVPDDPWLYAQISDDLEVTYEARCPDTWEPGIRSRVQRYLEHYNLHVLYSSQAAEEISDMEDYWRELLKDCDEDELRSHIRRIRKSTEKKEKNSWKAALYRGLEENFFTLVTWLKTKEESALVGEL